MVAQFCVPHPGALVGIFVGGRTGRFGGAGYSDLTEHAECADGAGEIVALGVKSQKKMSTKDTKAAQGTQRRDVDGLCAHYV